MPRGAVIPWLGFTTSVDYEPVHILYSLYEKWNECLTSMDESKHIGIKYFMEDVILVKMHHHQQVGQLRCSSSNALISYFRDEIFSFPALHVLFLRNITNDWFDHLGLGNGVGPRFCDGFGRVFIDNVKKLYMHSVGGAFEGTRIGWEYDSLGT